ncbi:ribonuclease T [Gilvimarinus sp. F26214L]|uniref:ribonuclease T n=1 Tax=Gilvimarinus sp. DZF01 TaxID=3461371 RepID=UPI004045EA48
MTGQKINSDESSTEEATLMAQRFRGFLPVVIDVETGGFNPATDALLEIAAVTLRMDEQGFLHPDKLFDFHVEPYEGANVEQAALDFTGIDLEFREVPAQPESIVINELFRPIRTAIKDSGCNRAVVVGHNAHFDLSFINAVVKRCNVKRNPFHPFSCFDTATLAGLAFGHTVLARACQLAGIEFDNSHAHSAAYDAERTAELFCRIVNRWQELGGWPLTGAGTKVGGPAE